MSHTGATVAAETVLECGASHVFGNPGTTELPFVNAVIEGDLTYVTCLHEDIAVGAASGFITRCRQLEDAGRCPASLAVANVHTTPGVAHALGNLHAADCARAPVLLTAGCQEPRHERRRPLLSGKRQPLVADFVKESIAVGAVDDLPHALSAAARTALSPPTGPVYVEFPLSVQQSATQQSPGSLGALPDPSSPAADQVRSIASQFEPGSVTIVVGADVGRAGRSAVRKVGRLAERLEAPVYAEPLIGEVGFPPAHPHWIGMLPYEPEAMDDRLTSQSILFLGCLAPEPLLDYEPPLWSKNSRAIWMGPHPSTVPAESSFTAVATGPIEEMLDQLLAALEPAIVADGAGISKERTSHRAQMRSAVGGQDQAEIDAKRAVAAAVASFSEEAVIVDEGVTTGFHLRDRGDLEPGQFIGHGSGGLGYGLPAAVGAAIAEDTFGDPARPVIGLIGDGSYQYYPQTLYTAAQHVSTGLTIVVPVNDGYGILRDRDEIDESSSTARPLTFDRTVSPTKNAESYGIRTRRLDDTADIQAAIEDAVTAGGVEVIAVDLTDTASTL